MRESDYRGKRRYSDPKYMNIVYWLLESFTVVIYYCHSWQEYQYNQWKKYWVIIIPVEWVMIMIKYQNQKCEKLNSRNENLNQQS